MAFTIFTIPLCMAFNLSAGSWIIQTDEIIRQANRVLIALEKQARPLEEMSRLMAYRDKKIEDGFREMGSLIGNNTNSVEVLSYQIEKLIEGQSVP